MFERTSIIRLGSNRGNARIYLQGRWLEKAGFAPERPISVELKPGKVIIRLDGNGPRRVSSKRSVPVLDIESQELTRMLRTSDPLVVVAWQGQITIEPSRIARKRSYRQQNGLEGSLFSGGGLLSQAAKECGYTPVFAVEWNPDYAEVYETNHPGATMHNLCVSELETGRLPQVELLTVGIPCEPFSAKRTMIKGASGAKRNREAPPEAHELGDMTFWALKTVDLINPYTVVIEEVPQFLQSGAGFILFHALERMGYNVEARILDPTDYGCLTGRKRAVILASQDSPNWPSPQPVNGRTLRDVLEPADSPGLEWFDRSTKGWLFDHWDKQTQKGNGFASQQVSYDDARIGAITKRYFAQQGDNPVVKHPEKEGVFRWLTLDEVRRLHGIPEDYFLGNSKTMAGEIAGQGVIVSFFKQIIAAMNSSNMAQEAIA